MGKHYRALCRGGPLSGTVMEHYDKVRRYALPPKMSVYQFGGDWHPPETIELVYGEYRWEERWIADASGRPHPFDRWWEWFAPESLKMQELLLDRGTKVRKYTGDYTFEGEIVSVVCKKNGEIRYVIEDDRGLMLIMTRSQFTTVEVPKDAGVQQGPG